MHFFNEESLAACFRALDGRRQWEWTSCSDMKGFVLGLLPELAPPKVAIIWPFPDPHIGLLTYCSLHRAKAPTDNRFGSTRQ